MNELEYLKKYIHPEDNLDEAIKRLEAGEPVQYIVGDVDFYGNIIKVNKNVLIPRRETEELVEKTIEYIKKLFPNQNISMLDIGTGSGCIPITLKKHFPNSNISAVDISEDALKVAVDNSLSNNVNINFIQSNLFENVYGKYHCIISNPPYIKEDEEIMDIVKNNEPHLALYAPNEGLYFYEEILKEANKYLEDKFIIAFEIGETQGEEILAIAGKYFPTSKLLLEKDLQHLDRFVFIINE
ncbi:MAG: peptide chain release factor N(5)-glutamine methyltransferase [Firmicutes bacterium]|nr:peptide chain release factor N(5)-glutamine methyltransferase [Bacillota bacterium]